MNSQIKAPEYLNGLTPDHPLKIYFDENLFLKNLMAQLSQVDIKNEFQLAYNLFNQIATVDVRYTRKENQLFPYLEKRGWLGPTHGMWRFHDENRKLIKAVQKKMDTHEIEGLGLDLELLLSELLRMTQVEELRLFPIALEILTAEDWQQMKIGEEEIGWMHMKKPLEAAAVNSHPGLPTALEQGFIKLSEGHMNLEQLNLVLQVIPFDLTFVDENDKVLFYNRGEERVFPRSAGVIGREVRFCHPPKSVSTVLKILEEFKAGRKDVAEFWINYRGKIIHIRYFPIRDQYKNYKGVIEISQDITEIKKIEGEKRLLDWEN